MNFPGAECNFKGWEMSLISDVRYACGATRAGPG